MVISRVEHTGRTRCKRTRTPSFRSKACSLCVVVAPGHVAYGAQVHGSQVAAVPVNKHTGPLAQVNAGQKGARRDARSECGRKSRGSPGNGPYVWRELCRREYSGSCSERGRVAYALVHGCVRGRSVWQAEIFPLAQTQRSLFHPRDLRPDSLRSQDKASISRHTARHSVLSKVAAQSAGVRP